MKRQKVEGHVFMFAPIRLVGVSMKGTRLSLAGAGRCGDLDLNALDVDQQQLLLEVLNHSSCQKVGVDLAPTIQAGSSKCSPGISAQ